MVCVLPSWLAFYFKIFGLCYDYQGTSIGCYEQRLGNTPCFPEDPNDLDFKFLLWTQTSRAEFTEVSLADIGSLVTSKPTKILLHGWTGSCFRLDWIVRMKEELLDKDDSNVFCMDYEQAVDGFLSYPQAVANIQVVGAALSVFIEEMKTQIGLQASDVHLIGHSLGAQVAAYAGGFLTGPLGRISGLDPAGPLFADQDPIVRLDPSDATFVDVIHTDAADPTNPLGLGILQPSGHADFYPNLGRTQPGCPTVSETIQDIKTQDINTITDAGLELVCDHLLAYEYYIESINSDCPFAAIACDLADAEAGTCPDCSDASCQSIMGFDADQNTATASYFLTTDDSSPYCLNGIKK